MDVDRDLPLKLEVSLSVPVDQNFSAFFYGLAYVVARRVEVLRNVLLLVVLDRENQLLRVLSSQENQHGRDAHPWQQ